MRKWKISEAKAKLSKLIELGHQEPQMIVNRDNPVAVLIGIEDYNKFEEFQQETSKPSVKELLTEIREINFKEDDLELTSRIDRLVPEFEDE